MGSGGSTSGVGEWGCTVGWGGVGIIIVTMIIRSHFGSRKPQPPARLASGHG